MDESKRSAFDVYRQQQEENEEDSEELSEECSVAVSRYVDFVVLAELRLNHRLICAPRKVPRKRKISQGRSSVKKRRNDEVIVFYLVSTDVG